MSNSFPRPYLISFVPLHRLNQPVGWPGLSWGRGKSHTTESFELLHCSWRAAAAKRGPALWGTMVPASCGWSWVEQAGLAWPGSRKVTLAPERSIPLGQSSERSRESGQGIPATFLATALSMKPKKPESEDLRPTLNRPQYEIRGKRLQRG